ncbi:bacterial low temperature requirement A protein-domain-containing protein [Cladochytrium replicatum]|nr:bacterial low temperature requirement A protein-domain-containing protein [Cladochytrium replicatum]
MTADNGNPNADESSQRKVSYEDDGPSIGAVEASDDPHEDDIVADEGDIAEAIVFNANDEDIRKDNISEKNILIEDVHFTSKEFGQMKETIVLYDRLFFSNRSSLLVPLLPRQFFIGDVLHRERGARKVTWDELFMDLAFVAVINSIGHVLKVPTLTLTIFSQFLLNIIPAFLLWSYANLFSNRLGADNFTYRIFIWLQMLFVTGLGISSAHVWDPDPEQNTAFVYTMIFIVARGTYIIFMGALYYYVPKFAPSNHNVVFSVLFPTAFWIASLFTSMDDRYWLWWAAFIVEISMLYGGLQIATKVFKVKYRFALNIEHYSERYGLLTLIVLGEIVVSLLWDSSSPKFTLGYLATAFGLLIAIAFQWIYFAFEGNHHYVHALRRSFYTAIWWQLFHLPMQIAMVANGVTMAKLIIKVDEPTKTDMGINILFTTSAGFIMICLAGIGLTHLHHGDNFCRVPRRNRLVVRVLVGIAIIIFGALGWKLPALAILGVTCGLCIFVVIFEEIGSLYFRSHYGSEMSDLESEGHSSTLVDDERIHPLAATFLQQQVKRSAALRHTLRLERREKRKAKNEAQEAGRVAPENGATNGNSSLSEIVVPPSSGDPTILAQASATTLVTTTEAPPHPIPSHTPYMCKIE